MLKLNGAQFRAEIKHDMFQWQTLIEIALLGLERFWCRHEIE
jgi:hypothetical protein